MSRSRAADDFATIRARIEELRRERDSGAAAEASEAPGVTAESDSERRRRERIEGFPPPWVPTIFLQKSLA